MKVTLKINLDNDAFVDNRTKEIKRILLDIIDRIDNIDDIIFLRDINGNSVGKFEIKN